MKAFNCQVLGIEPLSDNIYQIRLISRNPEFYQFEAGQYLMLQMPQGDPVPLSIASPPQQKNYIELHLRLMPAPSLSAQILEYLQWNQVAIMLGPLGQCFLRNPDKQNIFIAGGTGYSPMKSMMESAFEADFCGSIHLFLGADQSSDLYHHQYLLDYTASEQNFRYTPVIAKPDNHWSGEIGFPHQLAINEYAKELTSKDFYIAGSEAMVMAVYNDLLNNGVSKSQIFSDILDIKRENGEL
ncbi:MAG: FAD-binding oxidoreductase [Enterobacterales bacterium]|nr:FAD-binding oxidoreductase [Enterobacterales bacterium]